jgi:hypothetical protein
LKFEFDHFIFVFPEGGKNKNKQFLVSFLASLVIDEAQFGFF